VNGHLAGVLVKLAIFAAVSVVLTTVVIASLLDVNTNPTKTYRAIFSNSSGLQSGDVVRIAGVEVGKVTDVSLRGYLSQVTFSVNSDQGLTTTTQADIHYENLLGQRFLALLGGSTPGAPLRPGATIPQSNTAPALDLTALYQDFQPLFAALTPADINQISASIISILQGETGTIGDLVTQTASITANLADRGQVITQVVDNLTGLLDTVAAHNDQLGQLIDGLTQLASAVAGERNQIGSTITSVGTLTTNVSGLITSAGPSINQAITGLSNASATLAANQSGIDGAIQGLPKLLTVLNKLASSGSYLSLYLCNLNVQFSGPVSLLNPPTAASLITLPSGAVGDQTQHTANCS
jgi:phospholipid/cholesterol/gamma-HCH transport system substrate-binding protein